jgi:Lrp/AsnC family leucine-responsive transcriptional regulator
MEKENLSEGFSMDQIDQKILDILKQNAKLGTKEIASQIGLTITPTYERIRRLEI